MRTEGKGAMQKQRRAVKADACSGCEQFCLYGVFIPEELEVAHQILK